MWNISALGVDKLQIWCLTKTEYVHMQTPLQLLTMPNSYEAYSFEIFIPANSELSLGDTQTSITTHFLDLR